MNPINNTPPAAFKGSAPHNPSLPPPLFRQYPVTILKNETRIPALRCAVDHKKPPHLLNTPVQTPCGHRICQTTCYLPMLKEQQDSGLSSFTCPECEQPADPEKLFVDKSVIRELNQESVRCPNSKNNCSWEGNFPDLDRVHIKECTYAEPIKTDPPDQATLNQILSNHEQLNTDVNMLKHLFLWINEQFSNLSLKVDTLAKHGMESKQTDIAAAKQIEALSDEIHSTHNAVQTFSHALRSQQDTLTAHATIITELTDVAREAQSAISEARQQNLSASTSATSNYQSASHGNTETEFNWIVNNFEQELQSARLAAQTDENHCIHSEPFYLSDYHVKVQLYPYGDSDTDRKHLSIYVVAVKGKHDEKLVWPFKGSIMLLLMDKQNVDKKIPYATEISSFQSSSAFNKPGTGTNLPHGKKKFISHEALNTFSTTEPRYIDCDGTLHIKIIMIPPEQNQ